MEAADFENQLSKLLQDAGPGAIAELTDTTIAYRDGGRLVYADVDTDGTGALLGTFELDAKRWIAWKDWLVDWMIDPVLGVRHDLPGNEPRTTSANG